MLSDRCSHKQSSIGTSADCKVFRRGVLLVRQIASCREPVIENILLSAKHSLLVPAFAILAAPAKVGNSKPAALFQPPSPGRIPGRSFAEIETSVPCHQEALAAVLLQALH